VQIGPTIRCYTVEPLESPVPRVCGGGHFGQTPTEHELDHALVDDPDHVAAFGDALLPWWFMPSTVARRVGG
jgi:hypothetical protein